MDNDRMIGGPLSGVLVADFSRVLAGPLTTMWLADLGATVVKVERTGHGDETRQWGPPWAGETSTYFTAANRSKLSIALDLGDADDRALADELARRSDVLVENFRTGVMAGFGLDYSTVSRKNPGVVYASVTGFGSAGGKDLPGYDFVVQAVGGLMSITGEIDGAPSKVGVALVDVLAAKDAAIGILAALRERDRTGHGQHVEVNLLSSLLGSLANQASSFLGTGNSPSRMGNEHPSIAPYETLRCKSGLLAVACGNDAQFRKLTELLDIGESGSDPRFATNSDRIANRTALVALLEKQLSAEDAAVWEERLLRIGVPAGQVGTVESGFARAAALGLTPLVDLPAPHPPQVAHPIRYSRSEVRRPTPPPDLGADSSTIRQWLTSGASVDHLTRNPEDAKQ
ncbi:CaiB/BaiF CoA transferase family protein [Nocardia sp. NPDC050630]|uniref:CaiB/BaiF CoA transferase family protein n=1 Tax=Nocardia sp. NPDC050630 TaxID=3364321 RepID=UPI00378AE08E